MNEELEEMMMRLEPADPELLGWVAEGPFGPMLKHPLVFEIFFDPQRCGRINKCLAYKREAVAEARAARNWESYIWLHERPYRVDAFADIAHQLSMRRYWELLGMVWVDSENHWQDREQWHDLLTADIDGREFMSDEDVRCVFTLTPEQGGLLPETVVYRGYCHDDGLNGFSWTLDRARAEWFARRLRQPDDPPPRVATARVARDHVIAYITSRDESELVLLPEHAQIEGIDEV